MTQSAPIAADVLPVELAAEVPVVGNERPGTITDQPLPGQGLLFAEPVSVTGVSAEHSERPGVRRRGYPARAAARSPHLDRAQQLARKIRNNRLNRDHRRVVAHQLCNELLSLLAEGASANDPS